MNNRFFKFALLMLLIFMGSIEILTAQTQKGVDIYGQAVSDHFGNRVVMPDANTFAISSKDDAINGFAFAGEVKVFKWVETEWLPKGNAIIGNPIYHEFGNVLDMPDSNTLIAGSYEYPGVNNVHLGGEVRIYHWNGTSWIQKGLSVNGEDTDVAWATVISMPDSNTFAVGAYDAAQGIGRVQVFSWNGSSWIQRGSSIYGETWSDYAGVALEMSDSNTIAVLGAHNGGTVRVFRWNGTDWEQKGQSFHGESGGEQIGTSISMPDSNTIALGWENTCSVIVYKWDGLDWEQKGSVFAQRNVTDAPNLSMSDSNNIAVGFGAINGFTVPGQLKVYTYTDGDWYQRESTVTSENLNGSDSFARSISMCDSVTVAIGAFDSNLGGYSEGGLARVYLFDGSVNTYACGSYLSPSGNHLWTATGTYLDTIPNTSGLDSAITIHLIIQSVQTTIVNNGNGSLTASGGSSYQWINCISMQQIPAAHFATFHPQSGGLYACIVSNGNCSDTTECLFFSGLGMNELSEVQWNVYPNPTNDKVTVELAESSCILSIYNLGGKLLWRNSIQQQEQIDLDQYESGIYLFEVYTENGIGRRNVIKR